MVSPTLYVEAPVVPPYPFALDSVAEEVIADAHAGFGFDYEPQYCGASYRTVAACVAGASIGTISISVNTSRVATITGTGEPAGTGYTVDWGDAQKDTGVALDSQTNTYAADGTYNVVVTNADNDYRASVRITVTNGVASGPFTASAYTTKELDTDVKASVVTTPFVAYNLQSCAAIGGYADAASRARRSLELGEGRVMESVMEGLILADMTDVTPTAGTAVDVVDGLALLEEYAAQVYGNIPTFHMPRGAAVRLASRNSVIRIGNSLETVLGGKIAAGGGYLGTATDGTTDPAAGEHWLYVTGTVAFWRGEMINGEPVMVDNQPGAALGPRNYTNEYRVLAERPGVIGFECFAAGVLVTAASCCPAAEAA